MTVLYSNNAASTLASGINSTVTSMTVAAGTGGVFPNPGAGEYFYVTLANDDETTLEIVKVTARTNDVLTIERGFDGTTSSSFSAGAKVELRITKIVLDSKEPADATILKDADIGSTVQAYDANIVSDANLASFATAFTVPTSDGTSGQALVTDGSGTIAFAGVNATQLGSKAPAYYDDLTINALGSVSGTTDIDLADGTNVTATIAGATTFTISGITSGSVNTVTLYLTNAGAYTITWPSGTTFNRNAAPVLPASGDTIIVLETYDNATSYAGIQVWRSV